MTEKANSVARLQVISILVYKNVAKAILKN